MPHPGIRAHWEAEPCGTRGLDVADRRAFFAQLATERYQQEPYIPGFARFAAHRAQRVLEIGVGAGTDHLQWQRGGALAIGLDLTHAAVTLTREQIRLHDLPPRVLQGDAELLPFPDRTFDVVYAYGVLHHSTDPVQAFAEVRRVLKPGGILRALIYHRPSIVGGLLAVRWLTTPRRAIAEHLESPGTHSYTCRQARALCADFRTVHLRTVLGSGDLLLMRPSARYAALAWLWPLYPRWLVRHCARFGLGLLVEAVR
jgi:SAM-dependent methyltransferase